MPGAVKPSALVVYDKIDGIKVLPQAGMARVGGNVFPKQLQQFEAVGISNGPDGKPDTADDLEPRPRRVKWSLEEYTATFGDDDLQYVGTLDQTGLFTPNVRRPQPEAQRQPQQYRRRVGGGGTRSGLPVRDRRGTPGPSRCAPARTCWSPSRSTWRGSRPRAAQ